MNDQNSVLGRNGSRSIGDECPPDQAARPFLDVAASALGKSWRERCSDPAQQSAAAHLVQSHGLPDSLARILVGRGVVSAEVDRFLQPRLRDLMPDPSTLLDMEAAAERLAHAAGSGERVAIFGDYDVDGAVSAALLAEHLRQLRVEVDIHIPDRITEGYGPNVEAIRRFAQDGARLLVCVDCGTAGHEPLALARSLGLDVIVLDHHTATETLPPTQALVNPNRLDDLSGLGHLCAAGVVFLTLVALNRVLRRRGAFANLPEPDLKVALDLVALATVADVVPLVGLNRAFVTQGLSVMRTRGRPGLAALLDAAGLSEPPEAWHLGFLLGPRINAGGRIGDSGLGARLLTSSDPIESRGIAAELDRLNRERQVIESHALAEAEAEMDRALSHDPDRPVLVTGSPDWHPGIVGLIAARLKERFGRPAFAFAVRPDGSAVGSGRSIVGVDLGVAIRSAVTSGIANKGGGHAMAAGTTLPSADFDAFRSHLTKTLAATVSQSRASQALLVDGAVTAAGVTVDLINQIQRAGPFGQGAPEPIFVLPRHRLVDVAPVGHGHVRARLRSRDGATLGGIAFRAAAGPLGQALSAQIGQEVHVAGALSCNRWRGSERPQIRICDLAIPG